MTPFSSYGGSARQVVDTEAEHLDIDIAERTSRSAERILNQDTLSINTQLNYIVQPSISRRRVIVQSDSSSQRVVTLGTTTIFRILVLPDPPRTIDLCMMEPESGISWR